MTTEYEICEVCGSRCGGNKHIDAEFIANFGEQHDPHDPRVAALLCDDCFEEFWAWAEKNAPELTRVRIQ